MKRENKKFKLIIFKTGSILIKVKEPYFSNGDFAQYEIDEFIEKYDVM